ncbi:MAG TPA: demethoxyubiquinone hydroxylase family protein, partial [Holophagaceae bacterium]|nr:demethoxyubiquinone hydroxylase family protein [Holophagaceae bacterium]
MGSSQGPSAEACLTSILQRAYSGELAAALAYRGHWISLKHDREIAEIQRIEQEEWHHRRRLGAMLADLGSRPRLGLDAFQAAVGAVILIGCNMVGWFIPMYFAGRLESQNDREYEEAAVHAE